MLGAARDESRDTKPVNSATVIPPFTANQASLRGISYCHSTAVAPRARCVQPQTSK